MNNTHNATSQAGPSNSASVRRPQRPHTPDSATPEPRTPGDQGTIYAPTSISLHVEAIVRDTGPMCFDVTDEGTYISFLDPTIRLCVAFGDRALLDLATLLNRAAARVMQHGHGKSIATAPGTAFPETPFTASEQA